jgi:PEP-CTERM motif
VTIDATDSSGNRLAADTAADVLLGGSSPTFGTNAPQAFDDLLEPSGFFGSDMSADEIMAPLAGAATVGDSVSSPFGQVFDSPSLAGPFTAVPEPSSMVLAGVALLALISCLSWQNGGPRLRRRLAERICCAD